MEAQENCIRAIKGAIQGDQSFSPAEGRKPADFSAAACPKGPGVGPDISNVAPCICFPISALRLFVIESWGNEWLWLGFLPSGQGVGLVQHSGDVHYAWSSALEKKQEESQSFRWQGRKVSKELQSIRVLRRSFKNPRYAKIKKERNPTINPTSLF